MSAAQEAITATPSFATAVSMCIAVLEDGTAEGKEIARAELMRYGVELDRLAAQSGAAFFPDDTPVDDGEGVA